MGREDRPVISLATVRIVGPSMEPRLRNGDVYLVALAARVRPGDVVLLQHPDRPELLTVKRAVRKDTEGWWVEGDNPKESTDSRQFGAVPQESIQGRVLFRLRPVFRGPTTARRDGG